MPIAAEYFIGTVGGELVSHLAVCPKFESHGFRATRLVTMPEWQGAGVGTRFLNWVCEYHLRGYGRKGYKLGTFFHTSHPQLINYLKNSPAWILKSQQLYGGNKVKSNKSINATGKIALGRNKPMSAGYGGHFRAVQGFKYLGDARTSAEFDNAQNCLII